MSVSINTFPIDTVGGDVMNTFRGFVENLIILDTVSTGDNYRLEYRFKGNDNVNEQSDADLLLDHNFTVYPDPEAEAKIDVSIISDLLAPNIPAASGGNSLMSLYFQVQYREVSDSATGSWVSIQTAPTEFMFVLIHAGGRVARYDIENSFIDSKSKRFWRGYNNFITFVSDTTNRPSSRGLTINFYSKNKSFRDFNSGSIAAFDGVYHYLIPTPAATDRFINVVDLAGAVNHYYTIYDTTQDEDEFFLQWVSENGEIRQWCFTRTTERQEEYESQKIIRANRPLPTAHEEVIQLSTEGLSRDEFDYIRDIISSNLIKITNNGETYNIIEVPTSISYENYRNTYRLVLNLVLEEKAIMGV